MSTVEKFVQYFSHINTIINKSKHMRYENVDKKIYFAMSSHLNVGE